MRLNKKALMLSAAALSVLIGGAGAYVYHKTYFGKSLQLSLKDFEQGTRVSYKILTKQGAVATGEEVIGNAPLTLPVSNEYAQNGVVDYHLSIEPPEGEAEMLDPLKC